MIEKMIGQAESIHAEDDWELDDDSAGRISPVSSPNSGISKLSPAEILGMTCNPPLRGSHTKILYQKNTLSQAQIFRNPVYLILWVEW